MEQVLLKEIFDFSSLILTAPFHYLVSANQRVYWLYLLMAILLAGWVFIRSPVARREGAIDSSLQGFRQFIRFCFPKNIFWHKSARTDYIFFVINRIAYPWLIAPLIIGTLSVMELTTDYLGKLPFVAGILGDAGSIDEIVFTIVLLLAMDGALYVAHYLQHHIPPLWEFHKVHHSAEVLTPITVYRMHPIDDLVAGSLAGVVMGLVIGLFRTLYAEGIFSYTVVGLPVGLGAFYLFGYNLRHSHIWLPYHPIVSHFLISPAQHQIHHSSDPVYFGKNLGFIFAFWDWACGTLHVPRKREHVRYGIMHLDPNTFDTVWKLYWSPFESVGGMLKNFLKR
jgi:sterol desaturase/sphingolipid hydroxylase (fatty acid hydroxylase superfamily)